MGGGHSGGETPGHDLCLVISLSTRSPDENRLIGVKFELDAGDILAVLLDVLKGRGTDRAGVRIQELRFQFALEPYPSVDAAMALVMMVVLFMIMMAERD